MLSFTSVPARHAGTATLLILTASLLSAETARPDTTGTCNGALVTIPFTDVPGNSTFFCGIATAYLSGLTAGTSATTYTPGAAVDRDQMAAFVSRTLDQSLTRGSRRAALGRFWTPRSPDALSSTAVGDNPRAVKSDGADLWVTNNSAGSVSRVRASDGRLLETWTGAENPLDVLSARGRVYVTAFGGGGSLWVIDPALPAGAMTLVKSNLGTAPYSIAFDGSDLWMAVFSKLTRISFGFLCPCATDYTAGFMNPVKILYDGSHVWVTDAGDETLKQVASDGSVALSVPVGAAPGQPAFDGRNIWVPNQNSNSLTVVRVKDAAGNPLAAPFVLATLTANGLDRPGAAAFDGERVMVINVFGGSVSLFRALDTHPLGSVALATLGFTDPTGVCSDGLNFWITTDANRLVRF